ncbi:MAG: DUF1127 domain-containing protein [Stellaceae bacterium]
MSLISLFAAARDALAARHARRLAYTELTALDDRALADIGIHRSQIPAIVEGADCSRKAKKAEAAALRPRPVSALDLLPWLDHKAGRRA